jgi:hypothetical protein
MVLKQKFIALITLGLILLSFGVNGLQIHSMDSEIMMHNTASKCCDDHAIADDSEDTYAALQSFSSLIPTIFLVLALILFGLTPLPKFRSQYSPYQLHKLSRGVFQLE